MVFKRFISWAMVPLAIVLQLISSAAQADLPVYTDTLARGWVDGSWTTHSFTNDSPVHSGTASISVEQSDWTAIRLIQDPPLDVTGTTALRFWVHGGTEGGQTNQRVKVCQQLDVSTSCTRYTMPALTANEWTQVEVPLTDFTQVSDIQWNNQNGSAQPIYYLDDIVFVGAQTPEPKVVVYGDALSSHWGDWSWNTTLDPANATPTHSGSASLAVTPVQGWSGVQLGYNDPEDLTGLNTLRFWVHGGAAGGQRIAVSAFNGAGKESKAVEIVAQADVWTEVTIPLHELLPAGGGPLTINNLRWYNPTESAQPTYYLDDIALVWTEGLGGGGDDDGDGSYEHPDQIYTDALLNDWEDGSWNMDDSAVVGDFANGDPVHGGTASIKVDNLKGWGGMALAHDPALDVTGFDTLRFWIHGGEGGQKLTVTVRNGAWIAGEPLTLTPTAGTWTQVDLPLPHTLDPSAEANLVQLEFYNGSGNTQPTFYLDDIALVNVGYVPPPVENGAGPALNVDLGAAKHAISPYIYGMNFADEALARDLSLPVRRRGGDATSRYNWKIDMRNVGFNWYFENMPEVENPASLPDDSAANRFIDQNNRTGTKTLMTMPMLGWVANPRREGHPYDCAYKVSKYGAQQSVDPWDTDCGNGVLANGTPITNNDPEDTSIEIDPAAFVTEWVTYLVNRYGTAASGGVQFYNLDNEPMLWHSTHPDVHPDPTTYDELRDKTYAVGSTIKVVDPSAQTLGPSLWGWPAYFWSALDVVEMENCYWDPTCAVDRNAHGGTEFVAWYLQQMQAYEQAHGRRILDYLDLHVYPQVEGVFSPNLGSSSTQAVRLRSTRLLWDPTYTDESWIGEEIYLIPRMRDWVDRNYPGTKLALSEYSWGALGYLNGALAQADVLGIFGREGLDLATLWDPPEANQPGAMAFRMYLNYDGQGSKFGDVSVESVSADQEKLAVYAAERSTDGALTLMIVNKTKTNLESTATLAGFTPAETAKVYRYSAANLTGIVAEADQPMDANGFTAIFPAESITLLVAEPDAPICAAAVSANVTVQRGGFLYNRATKRYEQQITVTNGGAEPLAGPIHLALDDLSTNATLFNANSATACAAPSGSPYLILGTSDLAPNASLTAKLEFTKSATGSITYTTRVLIGADTL